LASALADFNPYVDAHFVVVCYHRPTEQTILDADGLKPPPSVLFANSLGNGYQLASIQMLVIEGKHAHRCQ
jgi:hypothetical protein